MNQNISLLYNLTRKPSPPSGSLRAAFFYLAIFVVVIVSFTSVHAGQEAAHSYKNNTLSINEVESGSLLIETNQSGRYYASPTVDTDVRMDITGLVARVNVTQRFTNPSLEWVNGVYVFPLPENAAVDHMQMTIGERIIEGKIKERHQAKKIYQQAKREGKKASLVEQQRPNIFTNSVANIGPNESVSITIQYQQTLTYDQGQFSIRFPMVVGIRYIPGTKEVEGFNNLGWAKNTDEVPDANNITPPVTETDQGHDNPVSISVNLTSGFPLVNIESSYHPISKQMLDANHYEIQLANLSTMANRDFELSWRPQTSHEPQAALFTQEKDDDRYALLMLMPPEVDWNLQSTEQATLPKEMIYVIDTSGSMSGGSMPQAKKALLMGLSQLKSDDWFNIIQFNSYTEAFSKQALPARENNIDRAKNFVKSLHANGGTEIAPALELALTGSNNNERIRQIVFLTDGSVGNEKQLFKIINRKLNNNRLYTVGIGSAPNSYFMSEAATMGRGTFTYIGKIEEVEEKMSTLLQKLNHPVLRDIEMVWQDNSRVDYWPNPIHDLYIGEPLIVSIKLPKEEKKLLIRGNTHQSDWSTTLPISKGGQATGLDVLWARNKIQSLSQKISHGVDAEEIKQAITELGLKHHIVTKHTSLVALDVTPTRPSDTDSTDKAVPVKKPHAWDMKIPGNLPQGATSMQMNILIGLILLLAGFSLRKFRFDKL